MNAKRVYLIMSIALGLLIAVMVAVTLGGEKMLKKESGELMNTKLENEVLNNEQTSLDQAKQDLKKYEELNQLAKEIVPTGKDQAKTTREILALADEAGITIATVGFPASDLGSPQQAPAGGGPKVNNSISQATPVEGIKDLLQLEIDITSNSKVPCTYDQLITFLKKLELNRRTAQVSTLSIQPDPKDNSLLSFSLTITVYIKP